jgi:multiple sugar transport system substrate-binding protein
MVQVLWFNAPMLEAAGVEPPSTWNELLTAAETLTADGVNGIAVPAGKNLASDQVAYSFMLTGGAGNWFTNDGQPNFNTPEVIDAISLYSELLQFSPTDSASFAWAEPQAALNNGSVAMAIEKGQYLPSWEAESGLAPSDLGCAPIPIKDEGGEPGSIYYSNAAMILSEDENRRAGASAFFTWVMEPANYAKFLHAEPGLFLPVTDNAAHVDQWRSNEVIGTYPECVDLMLELSNVGGLFGFVDGQYISRIGDISGQNILAQTIQRVYVEGEDVKSAVAWAQKEMENALR